MWLQSFGGNTKQFMHTSKILGCEMKFSVFFPPNVEKAPILYFLSGLTCNDRNFIEKASTAPQYGPVPDLPEITSPKLQVHLPRLTFTPHCFESVASPGTFHSVRSSKQ